jgi:transcriptional regulator with XRE-family HTH domain
MSFEGERLKALRSDQGLTQQALADRSGIDREKIAKIEVGSRRMSATDAAYLAHGLGVRADDLVARPRQAVHWRTSEPAPGAVIGTATSPSIARVGEWFEDFVDDALYLERRAQRYGLE